MRIPPFAAKTGFETIVAPALGLGGPGLCALIALGLGAGFSLGGHARAVNTSLAARAPEALAARAMTRQPIGIDLDGDGRFDLARPIEHPTRGVDAYGSGAFGAPRDGGRRAHHGVDLITTPGEPVRAPIAGVVTRIGAAYAAPSRLQYVEIVNAATQYAARVLYVGPVVSKGRAVAAGDVIGTAQNLAQRYPGGMTNHVHVELVGRRGIRLDPEVVLPAVLLPNGPAS